MTTLAWHDGGPGPWILFFPLIWVAAIALVVTVLRRTAWRGGRGPWHIRAATAEHSPIAVLGRRFAAGEIDEDEYWRRLSVLDEQFGRDVRGESRGGKGGAA
ncbi:SHOCT domain-containing protein [Actinacidiphila sp. DG2A-62]|jgi:putative membrane protein|uniref:SHOCT domain-containing protein n=1 Tax=Actinacidiphila sp. DG2A-62 TaxID=3108821 RepID=UPI002DBE63E7|nr:SHOCT domain-containing protein [Actinacidiphila sp. DG2A-62]MEC3998739.1 SHOCT domain-containing protein [Actinacidiphila sp. DG2A-62]